jgi:DNA-binding MarR family transcriptional regulator
MPDRLEPYIVRLEEALNRFIKQFAARHGPSGPLMSGSQRIVLKALATGGRAQVSEVAAHLGVTLSAATGLVDRMVRTKWVTRERDTVDRRVVWVQITPEGEKKLAEAEARRRLVLREMCQNLPDEDLKGLCDIFEKMGM